MAALIDTLVHSIPISDELNALAEKVTSSVVAVRASRHGGGAGVIWNDRGLIITNAHVVHGPRAEVTLPGGVRLPAYLVARSERLDLASLQIDGPIPVSGWAPAIVRDSTTLRPGELIVAVGHPLGERNAITLGMVGAVGTLRWHNAEFEAIRAAITLRPGNSGGALADVAGRVVGIPNLVVGRGQALAVPSHAVDHFLNGTFTA
jgi:serine protease Do